MSSPVETLSRRLLPWLEPPFAKLEAARASGRLSHAWLISGPEGVGKLNLAFVLARRLFGGDLEPGALDAPLEVGASRMGDRTPDHFEREQRPFFERVRAAYLALAAQFPERIKVIDAAMPLPQVQRQIDAEVAALVRRLGSKAR